MPTDKPERHTTPNRYGWWVLVANDKPHLRFVHSDELAAMALINWDYVYGPLPLEGV